MWAGACAAPLLSWGSITIHTSAGVLIIAQTSPAAAWHHLPSHAAAASQETALYPKLPVELCGWCQTLPACLLREGDGSDEISALSRHYLSPGCSLSWGQSRGLCCQQLPKPACDKGQGGTEPTSLQCLPSLPCVIWLGHWGSPMGSHQGPGLCSGTPSRWPSPGGRTGGTGRHWGHGQPPQSSSCG